MIPLSCQILFPPLPLGARDSYHSRMGALETLAPPYNQELPNPLRTGRRMRRIADPCVMVVFGGSGDLTKRKLVPALYSLSRKRMAPAGFTVLGIARSSYSNEQYREHLRRWMTTHSQDQSPDTATWDQFSEGIHYITGDFGQAETYSQVKVLLEDFDRQRGTEGNRIFYLATPPSEYSDIVRHLGEAGLAHNDHGWVRIIIEKPFGRDLASARALNRDVSAVFTEDQVYRIDHYLGKETVQNLLAFRFANGIFEPIWNRQFVDSVQITAAENIGVGTRGGYYEESGALRDMVQNHIMQLLTFVAMEPPADFAPNSVRDEKAKVLRSIPPFSEADVSRYCVRGQYGPGFIWGKPAPGYRDEPNVSPASVTETYAAIRFTIENWRWAGVPFYVRTGKNLAKQVTEIAIMFQKTPHLIFQQAPTGQDEGNVLALRIQPDEGITLKFLAKQPGQSMSVRPVNMDFRYGTTFGPNISSAYERLLFDCMIGDPTLFDRIDSVEAAWQRVQPILDSWGSSSDKNIPIYPSGSWGPDEADELLARDSRRWRML